MKTQSIIVVIWCFLMPLSLWSQVKVDTDGKFVVKQSGAAEGISIYDQGGSTPLRIFRSNDDEIYFTRGENSVKGFRLDNQGRVVFGAYNDGSLTTGRSKFTVMSEELENTVSIIATNKTNGGDIFKSIAFQPGAVTLAGWYWDTANKTYTKTFYVFGNGEVYTNNLLITSDISTKREIKTIESSLDKVMQLRGVTFESEFDLKDNLELSDFVAENEQTNMTQKLVTQMNSERSRKHMGVVAQEVEEVVPEVVRTTLNGTKAVAYTELVGLLIEAIKEQQSQIEELKAQVFSQESTNPVRNLRSVSDKDALSISSDVAVKNMLYQNVPNPFTSDTKIRYTLSEDVVNANLYIYNMQETQIKNISGLSGGAGVITINGRELKAGMYIYTLIADGKEVDTKRMILTD
ncbi:T9SS type A sorting domain-containing protein [Coprobacter fastidiosus]|uniref:T9SS type A sorting domain-containing protein n=1 Tax=Coprobacter fastidiosus TaxID=1099853 RepID=UPI002675A074|nr:T9SS type A sorting domain-containing protein [Coprobacter fastidiosus]